MDAGRRTDLLLDDENISFLSTSTLISSGISSFRPIDHLRFVKDLSF